jgi:hypothetical protein
MKNVSYNTFFVLLDTAAAAAAKTKSTVTKTA